jgi:predicted transcriptional regulator
MYRTIENKNNDSLSDFRILNFAKKIITSYLNNNPVLPQQLEPLIRETCTTLKQLPLQNERPCQYQGSVHIFNSVTNAFIICLEDGKKLQCLSSHLTKSHKMTPKEYRSKWNLPSDYPMACQRYKKKRSELFHELQQKYPNRKLGRPRKIQVDCPQPKGDNMRKVPRHRWM